MWTVRQDTCNRSNLVCVPTYSPNNDRHHFLMSSVSNGCRSEQPMFVGFLLLLRHCVKGCSTKGRLLTIKRNVYILAPDAQKLHYSLITASMLQTGLHNENHLPFKVQQETKLLSCPFILKVCFSHYRHFWLLQLLELSAPGAVKLVGRWHLTDTGKLYFWSLF